MRLLISLLLLAMTSSYSFASPYDDDVLFGCFFNNQKEPKEVVVLRSGNDITYMYGKQDPSGEDGVIPEITIKKNISQLTQAQHNNSAEGGSLYELNIPNGKYAYNIGYMSKDGKPSGDIGIYKNGQYISTLSCTDVWENNLNNQEMMKGIPNDDGTENTPSNSIQQSTTQSSQQTQSVPIKIQIQDVPYDIKTNLSADHRVTRHIYVYSLIDSIAITGLSVDRGSCYKRNFNPNTIAYGKRLDFPFVISSAVAYANTGWNWTSINSQYSKCMWSEIVVNTSNGDFTFTN
jgi:hypothetical protein